MKNLIIVLSLIVGFAASAQSVTERADQAYSAGEFNEAARLYNEAAASDGVSSDLYYNLGNTYYRLDSLAQSIIAYERALMLDPTNSDARTNLEFVNTKIIDVPNDASSYTTIFIEKAMRMMTANGWAVVTLVFFIVLLSLCAGYIFLDSVKLRKICFFSGIIILIVTGITLFITMTVTSRMTTHNKAIITDVSTQLSTSPSTPVNASQQAFLLHEGSKVEILDSVATPLDPVTKMWYEVKVDNEHRAWIDKEAVEII